MITKPTVFVLGAGVSMPYGFPSGTQLVREICGATFGLQFEDQNSLLDKGEVTKILHDVFGELKTHDFGKALFLSQNYSIDAFLEGRPEFIEIGKWAISLFILRNEIEANLFSFNFQDKGFYRYLTDKLGTKWENFNENKLAFITFNYDRSLEHFLFTALHHKHGKSEQECAEAISRIPIIHVHGSLGKLPWQAKDGIPYGGNLKRNNNKLSVANGAAASASKQINIMPDGNFDFKVPDEITDMLTNAERIYFLGFSYHDDNIKKIGVDSLAEIERRKNPYFSLSRMKGTGLGLEKKELEAVQRWHIDIPDGKIDALQFLRNYANLD
jgi:hypothetical protein